MTDQAGTESVESVESFRLRARDWISANLPRLAGAVGEGGGRSGVGSDEAWIRARELQNLLYNGGFAGICYPVEYGGLGLMPEHQRAFSEEATGYEMPLILNIPTFSICAPTLLDLGTEEQKREHISAVIRGEEVIVQLLSEPSGGSDLAGVRTRATRDGDVFVLNGSKTWSSGAYAADYGMCLARTDWDAPKHRGLTMFLIKVNQPGIDIRRIKQINGNQEFCEEFFDDVHVPLSAVVGEVNGGWSVASRVLFHERNAVGGGSPYVSGTTSAPQRGSSVDTLVDLVRRTGQAGDQRVRELVAESYALTRVQEHLIDRVVAGMASQQLPPPASAIIRLFDGERVTRRAEIALEIAGASAVGPDPAHPDDRDIGENFLLRQARSLGGGSTEMARNIISERVLGMPREYAPDRDVPFNQVKRGRT
jgi:alkylation response protein AidB-like acyl-CoA dehydrogenase